MSKSIDTICVHGKEHTVKDQNYAISYPIYQTASFSHLTPGHNPNGFDYTRESNPTRRLLEETVSALEGAYDAVAFASGMAAVSAVFEYFKPGDHVICGEDLYGGVVRLASVISAKNGCEVEYVDTSNLELLKAAIRKNTKAIYFETPTNPMMHVTDIQAAAKLAHEAGALLIVDNTFMTPYFQNPLSLGADVIIHSGTKYLSGHNDTICGFLCSKTPELAQYFRLVSKTTGGTLSPFDSWLCLRGIKTLALRMERHQSNALAVADWLKEQDCVEKVYFVGLKEDPGYELNRKQSRGFSGMISFTVKTKEQAVGILKNVKLITFAESLGGTETLITYPTVQTHPDVPAEQKEKLGITDRLLRLSVGIENPEDIIEDLKQAMEKTR